MREEQSRRTALEHCRHRLPSASSASLDRDALAGKVRELGSLADVLGRAEPVGEAKVYAELTYHPGKRKILVASKSDQDHIGEGYVSEGGLEPPCPAKGTSTSS